MQFGRLKELVGKLGGVLVLDGDRPEFVILPYEKYEKMEAGEEVPILSRNGLEGTTEEQQSAMDKLNKEILALKEEIRQKEEAELGEQVLN